MRTRAVHKMKKHLGRPRVADEIMDGMRRLRRMLDEGKTPTELFSVKVIDVPEPSSYSPAKVRELRESLCVSQSVFAHLLGVSLVLVKSWERGVREPNLMARRLFDTIRADPAAWLAALRERAA